MDEALDQWGVAFIIQLNAVEARHLVIEEDCDEDVQQAYKDWPVPIKLCARKLTVDMVTESTARHLSSFDDLNGWDPTTAIADVGESVVAMQTDANGNRYYGRSNSAHTPI